MCLRIKKVCDYLDLFSKVNREMIEGYNKSQKKKSSDRIEEQESFIRVTEIFEEIDKILKEIHVRSITEVPFIVRNET